MTVVVAHVAGVPLEETLLYAGPALTTAGAVLAHHLRLVLRRRRSRSAGPRRRPRTSRAPLT